MIFMTKLCRQEIESMITKAEANETEKSSKLTKYYRRKNDFKIKVNELIHNLTMQAAKKIQHRRRQWSEEEIWKDFVPGTRGEIQLQH